MRVLGTVERDPPIPQLLPERPQPRSADAAADGEGTPTAAVLTPPAAVRHLLERSLIPVSSIVDGELVAVDVARRNRNVKVVAGDGTAYLLKQGADAGGAATVAREAAIYRMLADGDSSAVARRYLPRCFGYDAETGVLVLELFRHARDLREYHGGGRRFPQTVAASLARALAALHALRPAILTANGRAFDEFLCPPPWALALHRPRLEHLSEMSGANLQLIRIIQHATSLCDALDRLWLDWHADVLIHGDMKWENCLIVRRPGSARSFDVKLVDWEFAGIGDACWDVGSAFAGYLAWWLWSIPVTGEEPPDRFLELAAFPLDRMQPAIRAFWAAYVRAARLDAESANEAILRAVRYAAARLIQTAYEHMQQAPQLTGNVVCLLQLSANILERPRDAAHLLLGLPVTSASR